MAPKFRGSVLLLLAEAFLGTFPLEDLEVDLEVEGVCDELGWMSHIVSARG